MLRLYENDFGWFGSLKKLYGTRFMKIVDDFIDEIIDYKIPGHWSYDLEFRPSASETVKQAANIVLGHKVSHFGLKKSESGDGFVFYSFITPDRFFSAAQRFVSSYIMMVSDNSDKCFVFDQLFQPHHLKRLNRYFAEGTAKAIVVDRDARDMFVLGKNIWPQMGMPVAFPDDATEFALFYSKLIKSADIQKSDFILPLHFEDLIYNYEDTLETLKRFIGVEAGEHEKIKTTFQPEKSIKNTQNYRMDLDWIEEVRDIETLCPEYIYQFPYDITPKIDETSDP